MLLLGLLLLLRLLLTPHSLPTLLTLSRARSRGHLRCSLLLLLQLLLLLLRPRRRGRPMGSGRCTWLPRGSSRLLSVRCHQWTCTGVRIYTSCPTSHAHGSPMRAAMLLLLLGNGPGVRLLSLQALFFLLLDLQERLGLIPRAILSPRRGRRGGLGLLDLVLLRVSSKSLPLLSLDIFERRAGARAISSSPCRRLSILPLLLLLLLLLSQISLFLLHRFPLLLAHALLLRLTLGCQGRKRHWRDGGRCRLAHIR